MKKLVRTPQVRLSSVGPDKGYLIAGGHQLVLQLPLLPQHLLPLLVGLLQLQLHLLQLWGRERS